MHALLIARFIDRTLYRVHALLMRTLFFECMLFFTLHYYAHAYLRKWDKYLWDIFKWFSNTVFFLLLVYKSHFLCKCSIAKILEAGLMTRWRQVYWLPDDACSIPDGIGSGSPSVTVTDMQGSFMILGIGKNTTKSRFDCIIGYTARLFFFILPVLGLQMQFITFLHITLAFLHFWF